MDPQELFLTGLRALLVYVVMLFVMRLLGKRTIGNFSAFDLLVALMLGEVVDEVIYGDVSLAQGFVAIFVLAAVEYANSWLSYGSDAANRWLEGEPTPLVVDGSLQRDGMRKERMHERDVLARAAAGRHRRPPQGEAGHAGDRRRGERHPAALGRAGGEGRPRSRGGRREPPASPPAGLMGLLAIAVRALVAYGLLLVIVRASGKRTIAQSSPSTSCWPSSSATWWTTCSGRRSGSRSSRSRRARW